MPWTLEEAQALLLGTPGAAAALGLRSILADAQLKLLAALPGDVRPAAMQTSTVFHVDDAKWFSSEEAPRCLVELAQAAADQLRIEVQYRRNKALNTESLEPLGLVLKAGVWYLVARTGGKPWTYRVSRIASVALSSEQFERPVDFDLVAYWEHARGEFEQTRPRVDVVLRIKRAEVPALRAAVDWSVRQAIGEPSTETVDGRLEMTLPFERLEYAYDDLIKLGGKVEVTDPLELRQRLARTGQDLVSRYRTALPQRPR